VDHKTLGLNANHIEGSKTSLTRGILNVHYGGFIGLDSADPLLDDTDFDKGKLPLLEEKLGVKGEWKIEERENGIVAELNVEELIKDLDTPDSYGDVLAAGGSTVKFTAFSQYPAVLRDIAVWIPEGTTSDALLETIREQARLGQGSGEGTEWLVQSRLFDEFSKDDKTSYAYKLVFQSMDKTLTDAEVGEIMDRVTETLNNKEGYEVR